MEGSSLGLWVPSYVEPGERNLLLNPQVPAYQDIAVVIERIPFVLGWVLVASTRLCKQARARVLFSSV